MLGLDAICEMFNDHKDDYDLEVAEFSLGGRHFNFNTRPSLLGIVNMSTDSWFNHVICYTPDQAVQRAKILTAQGADIVDLGAEASSPGTSRTDAAQQVASLLPVIEALQGTDVLTSIDTYYPEVAEQCLAAGATVINYTGTEDSETMYRVVAEHDAAIVMCYVQGPDARSVGEFEFPDDPMTFLADFFARETEKATSLGVDKIFIDPAVGLGYTNFYYSYENIPSRLAYQYQTLIQSFRLRRLGFPVFAQIPTPLEIFGEDVRSAQMVGGMLAMLGKVDLIRTHEVSKLSKMVQTLEAL